MRSLLFIILISSFLCACGTQARTCPMWQTNKQTNDGWKG